jgi:hypothetical protein
MLHQGGTKMSGNIVSRERRNALLLGAAGAGLAFLPAWVYAKTINGVSARACAALGYWLGAGDFVTAAGDAAATQACDVIRDARRLAPRCGDYRMRIVRAVNPVSCSIEALYADGVPHRCWQAWQEGSLLQHSSPVAIRWSAQMGAALPLTLRSSGRATTVFVPPAAGTYVLALARDGSAVPAWTAFALRADDRQQARLVQRGDGAHTGLTYWLLEVETVEA